MLTKAGECIIIINTVCACGAIILGRSFPVETLKLINFIIAVVFTVCYSYQFAYVPLQWILGAVEKRRRARSEEAAPKLSGSYAVLICARNEEAVIGDLLRCVKEQTYKDLTAFVLADNCTDGTAELAGSLGAVVYERNDPEKVGKGYAMDALLKSIRRDFPSGFDGYFVFDADNYLPSDYVEKMLAKKEEGFDILTSYRNSKNYGDNWISSGYALWFLRESRYLNHARSLIGSSCAVSGTGFFFSRKVEEETGGWPYFTLTEDIEFSIERITKGYKIGVCVDAEVYDEQPVKFGQSWRQRMRWTKGYLQVLHRYGGKLLRGMFRGKWSCFDMTMNIMPAFFLSAASFISNLVFGVIGLLRGGSVLEGLLSITEFFFDMYLILFAIGAITVITEWKHIKAGTFRKILSVFTFPLFMFTYIPIALSSVFAKPEWKPIEHSVSAEDIEKRIDAEKH